MNRYIYMQVLLAMSFVGAMHGAAHEVKASTQRVIGYFKSVGDAVERKSQQLRDGIAHFFGTHDTASDLKKAALSLRSALGAMDAQVSRRAYLYGAALLLVSGNVDQASYSTAGKMVEGIVANAALLPIDRMRAYILLDEIMHISNGAVPLNISKLREAVEDKAGKWVAALKDKHDGLAQEFMFRLARSFYYDGGGEHGSCFTRAGMTLSLINNSEEIKDASLRADIDALHARLPKDEYAELGASIDISNVGAQGGLVSMLRSTPPIADFTAFEQEGNSEASCSSMSSHALCSSSRPSGLRPSMVLTSEQWSAAISGAKRASMHNHLAHEAGCCDADCMQDGESTVSEPVVYENLNQNPSSSSQLIDDPSDQRSAKRGGFKKKFSLTKYDLRKKKFRGR